MLEWRAGGNGNREGDVWSVMTLMYYASMNIYESSQGLESSELAAFMLTHSVDNFQEAKSFIAQMDTKFARMGRLRFTNSTSTPRQIAAHFRFIQ